MIRFLLVYLSVYSLVHYYLFRKIKAALLPGRKATTGIILLMVVMIAAPIMVRLAERGGMETGARFSAYTSFSWMGLVFLFITLAATVDAGRFVILAAEKVQKRKFITQSRISPRQLLLIQVMLTVAVYSYGLFEAADIRLEHIQIVTPKISEQTGRIRMAQISDVHLGLIVREKRLKRILARINEAKPDLLVSTGDLVDGQLNHLINEAGLLAALKPTLGKIAITGNHEFHAGLPDALDFTKKSGFALLRDQGLMVGGINIVGVDDPTVKSLGTGHAES